MGCLGEQTKRMESNAGSTDREPQKGKPGHTVGRNLNGRGHSMTREHKDSRRDRKAAPLIADGESDQGIVLRDGKADHMGKDLTR